MFELFGQMMKLPLDAFAWFMTQMAGFAGAVQRTAGGGIDSVFLIPASPSSPPPPSLPPPVVPAALPIVAAIEPATAVTLGDDVIKLVQYTIVSIKRGEERILKRGETLVVDPMEVAGFGSWMIAEYTARHAVPAGDQMYLQVYAQILDSWGKQPLHYEERQLRVLEDIARKIGPTASPAP